MPLQDVFTDLISSLRCIQVIAGVLGRAGEAGQKQRLEAAERGEITYRPSLGLQMPEEAEGEDESAKASRTGTNTSSQLGEEGIDNAAELAAKMDAAGTGDGRKLGHRLKASA